MPETTETVMAQRAVWDAEKQRWVAVGEPFKATVQIEVPAVTMTCGYIEVYAPGEPDATNERV